MDLFALDSAKFIDLNLVTVGFLFIVGFIGGLVSGFIGSGGAFILTPGMMGLGVPGTVAVASNMCHKFPKALVGALKRFRYGQVDVKMGLVIAASAGVGVQCGIAIQRRILERWGQAGSDLYVSLAFVAVLFSVGGSLLGVQLGAIGTTYVRENMIKLVMGTIMLIVAVSRVIAIPCYLERLDVLTMAPGLQTGLKTASFICMCLGLLSGAALILAAMWRGRGTAAAPAA